MSGEKNIVEKYEPNNHLCEIRRILLPDIDEFILLQYRASVFFDHYPEHKRWFDHAVFELIEGKRVAFGIYVPVLQERGTPILKLAGSVMLKKKLYSDVVVLKNLFIEPAYQNRRLGTKLCNAAELYCAKGGFSRIFTEVPSSEINTINFLLTRGYIVEKTIESPYVKGDFLCKMSKKILPRYSGDSFDLPDLSLWILRHIFDLTELHEEGDGHYSFDFNLKYPVPEILVSKITPKGIALIYHNLISDEDFKIIIEKAKGTQVCIVFCEEVSLNIERNLIDNGILILDEVKIKTAFKDLFAYKFPSFNRDELAGIIVTISPQYFKKALELRGPFTYFKSGNMGKSLKKGDYVFLYTDIIGDKKEEGIRGYGRVKDISSGKHDEIWKKFETMNPLFTEEGYRNFVETKKSILGILIEDFHRISTINSNDLEKIFGCKIDYEEISQFYISHIMLNQLLEKKTQLPLAAVPIDIMKTPTPVKATSINQYALMDVDFLLITPLVEECDALLSKFLHVEKVPPSTKDIQTYYKTELSYSITAEITGKYSVIIMPLQGPGRLQALSATKDAINRWNPKKIILVGIAAGRAKENVNLGDILVAQQILDDSLQKLTAGNTDVRWVVHRPDQRLLNSCLHFKNDTWQEKIQTPRPDGSVIKCHFGHIVTGDDVIAIEEKIEKYGTTWSKLKGAEMEAGGVAMAAAQSPRPPGFLMIRSVSDHANQDKGKLDVEKWRAYACDAAASFTVAFLESGPLPID
jgi:nucleoside phosphorylase/ribosomal protein S18 acetylase RimI-like enzyme